MKFLQLLLVLVIFAYAAGDGCVYGLPDPVDVAAVTEFHDASLLSLSSPIHDTVDVEIVEKAAAALNYAPRNGLSISACIGNGSKEIMYTIYSELFALSQEYIQKYAPLRDALFVSFPRYEGGKPPYDRVITPPEPVHENKNEEEYKQFAKLFEKSELKEIKGISNQEGVRYRLTEENDVICDSKFVAQVRVGAVEYAEEENEDDDKKKNNVGYMLSLSLLDKSGNVRRKLNPSVPLNAVAPLLPKVLANKSSLSVPYSSKPKSGTFTAYRTEVLNDLDGNKNISKKEDTDALIGFQGLFVCRAPGDRAQLLDKKVRVIPHFLQGEWNVDVLVDNVEVVKLPTKNKYQFLMDIHLLEDKNVTSPPMRHFSHMIDFVSDNLSTVERLRSDLEDGRYLLRGGPYYGGSTQMNANAVSLRPLIYPSIKEESMIPEYTAELARNFLPLSAGLAGAGLISKGIFHKMKSTLENSPRLSKGINFFNSAAIPCAAVLFLNGAIPLIGGMMARLSTYIKNKRQKKRTLLNNIRRLQSKLPITKFFLVSKRDIV